MDFDNTIVNSSKAYCDVYRKLFYNMEEYKFVNWKEMQEYNVTKYCKLAENFSESLFDTELFFEELEFLNNNTKLLIHMLTQKYDIHIATIGTPKNIELKSKWIKNNLPSIKNLIFISNEGNKHDKSIIDMSGGILIDDNLDCLDSSNAENKFVAGRRVAYNQTSKYTRLEDWSAIYNVLDCQYNTTCKI